MKKMLVLIFCVMLLLTASAFSAAEVEVPLLGEDSDTVASLLKLGIIKGRGAGLDLSGELTRAEALTLIDRMFPADGDVSGETPFEDIRGHWAEDTVKSFYSLGYIDGASDAAFMPDKTVGAREFVKTALSAMGKGVETLDDAYVKSESIGLTADPFARMLIEADKPLTRSDAARLCRACLNAAEIGFADRLNLLLPKDGNYMFSPLSIKLALAMTANGADGETQREILEALEIADINAFNSYAEGLIRGYSAMKPITLDIANSIWINSDKTRAQFAVGFKNIIQNSYFGETNTVDDKTAVKEINSWVSEKTAGKIPSLISSNEFAAAILNAVYFNAAWRDEFVKEATYKEIFTDRNGKKTEIDFMHKTKYMQYAETENARVLSLPYKNRTDSVAADEGEGFNVVSELFENMDISFYILLPKTEVINPAAETEKAAAMLENTYVKLSLPKFELESTFSLNTALAKLGVNKLFSSQAELGPMLTDAENMKILEAVHKTYIKVDERGTEAAAVTGMLAGATSRRELPEPIEFNADRPFLFVVRDNASGEELFVGEFAWAK